MHITVRDDDGDIRLAYEDLLKYASHANIIACALMLRVSARAFELLSPDEPVWRKELTWRLGFPGSGILDCVEMISRATREGRCLSDPAMPAEGAPPALPGHFIFKIGYRGQTATIIPSSDIFDDEFRAQVSKWQEAREEVEARKAYLAFKQEKVRMLMETPTEKLLRSWLSND